MMIVQRHNQEIDYPSMIGWGVFFFLFLSPFAILSANVIMRPRRIVRRKEDPDKTSNDYWSKGTKQDA